MRTNPNHKYQMAYTPWCSCGWKGRTHALKSDCAADWRAHRERCEKEGD